MSTDAMSTNNGRVQGKAALVTGAGGGIGAACALALAREGAAVAVADIDLVAAKRTAAYIEEEITVQPTYPHTDGDFSRPQESVTVWIDYNLPWTDRDSADAALAQALGFLKERCSD